MSNAQSGNLARYEREFKGYTRRSDQRQCRLWSIYNNLFYLNITSGSCSENEGLTAEYPATRAVFRDEVATRYAVN